MEASKAEARASLILNGLGFTPTQQAAANRTFSGGWRMRLALARALFCKPGIYSVYLIFLQISYLLMKSRIILISQLSSGSKDTFPHGPEQFSSYLSIALSLMHHVYQLELGQ
jgi:ABC-type thiamine transport system ATPase subunit